MRVRYPSLWTPTIRVYIGARSRLVSFFSCQIVLRVGLDFVIVSW